jgi:hypothetical protein
MRDETYPLTVIWTNDLRNGASSFCLELPLRSRECLPERSLLYTSDDGFVPFDLHSFPCHLLPSMPRLVVGSVFIAFGIWGVGALMIAAFVIPAAAWFHWFWELEDETQKTMQTGFFFLNVIALAMSLVLFGIFTEFGSELPFTITDSLFDF